MQNDNDHRTDSIFSLVYDFHITTKAIILSESNRMLAILQNTTDTDLKSKYEEWRKHKNEYAKKMVMQEFSEDDAEVKAVKLSINHLEKERAQKTTLFSQSEKLLTWQSIKQKLEPHQAAVEIIRIPVYGT